MASRTPKVAATFLVLAGACAAVPERYKDINAAMQAEVEPLVEKVLTVELNKDADRVDYESIRSKAMGVRALFRQAMEPGRNLYLESEKARKHAGTAASWFRKIAVAASRKEHANLVELYKQKQTICSKCHEY